MRYDVRLSYSEYDRIDFPNFFERMIENSKAAKMAIENAIFWEEKARHFYERGNSNAMAFCHRRAIDYTDYAREYARYCAKQFTMWIQDMKCAEDERPR